MEFTEFVIERKPFNDALESLIRLFFVQKRRSCSAQKNNFDKVLSYDAANCN